VAVRASRYAQQKQSKTNRIYSKVFGSVLFSLDSVLTLCASHHNAAFETLIAGSLIGSIWIAHGIYQSCQKSVRWLYPTYIGIGLFGTFLWRLDQVACTSLKDWLGDFWWQAYIGSLHGYWHLLMAIHVYLACTFALFFRCQLFDQRPELRWWIGVIPYVHIPRI